MVWQELIFGMTTLAFAWQATPRSKMLMLKIISLSFKDTGINDILHMSFLAGTHVFIAYPAYTTTEI